MTDTEEAEEVDAVLTQFFRRTSCLPFAHSANGTDSNATANSKGSTSSLNSQPSKVAMTQGKGAKLALLSLNLLPQLVTARCA